MVEGTNAFLTNLFQKYFSEKLKEQENLNSNEANEVEILNNLLSNNNLDEILKNSPEEFIDNVLKILISNKIKDKNLPRAINVFISWVEKNNLSFEIIKKNIDKKEVTLILAKLIQNNSYDEAKKLLPYVEDLDLENYPNTLQNIFSNQNVKGLYFLLENFNNIYFSHQEVLIKSIDVFNFEIFQTLIEKFKFNLTEQNIKTGDSVMLQVLKSKTNDKHDYIFYLLENHLDKIDLLQLNLKNENYFNFIDRKLPDIFLKPILKSSFCNKNYLISISKIIFDPQYISNFGFSEIYDLFLKNPEIDKSEILSSSLVEMFLDLINYMFSIQHSKNIENSITVFEKMLEVVSKYPLYRDNLSVLHFAIEKWDSGTRDSQGRRTYLVNSFIPIKLLAKKFPELTNVPYKNGKYIRDYYPSQDFVNIGCTMTKPTIPLKIQIQQLVKFIKNLFKKQQINIIQEEITNNETSLLELQKLYQEKLETIGKLFNQTNCNFDISIRLKIESLIMRNLQFFDLLLKTNLDTINDDLNFLKNSFFNHLENISKLYINATESSIDSSQNKDINNETTKQLGMLEEQLNICIKRTLDSLKDSQKMEISNYTKLLQTLFRKDSFVFQSA